MPVNPCLIRGNDLWIEIYNDAENPVKLLCDRLGCQMVKPNDFGMSEGEGDNGYTEPSPLRGWYLVSWAGECEGNFSDEASYEKLTLDHSPVQALDGIYKGEIDLYLPSQLVAEIGEFNVFRRFRGYRVITSSEQSLSFVDFSTGQEAINYCLAKLDS